MRNQFFGDISSSRGCSNILFLFFLLFIDDLLVFSQLLVFVRVGNGAHWRLLSVDETEVGADRLVERFVALRIVQDLKLLRDDLGGILSFGRTVILNLVRVTRLLRNIISHVHLLLKRLDTALGLVSNAEDSELLVGVVLLLINLVKLILKGGLLCIYLTVNLFAAIVCSNFRVGSLLEVLASWHDLDLGAIGCSIVQVVLGDSDLFSSQLLDS